MSSNTSKEKLVDPFQRRLFLQGTDKPGVPNLTALKRHPSHGNKLGSSPNLDIKSNDGSSERFLRLYSFDEKGNKVEIPESLVDNSLMEELDSSLEESPTRTTKK